MDYWRIKEKNKSGQFMNKNKKELERYWKTERKEGKLGERTEKKKK